MQEITIIKTNERINETLKQFVKPKLAIKKASLNDNLFQTKLVKNDYCGYLSKRY